MPRPVRSIVLLVAAYLRISLDATDDAENTQAQGKRARTMAERHGLPAPVEYVEPGSVSASKPRGRNSAYARLLTDVRAGRVNVVLVGDMDRLTRQPSELEDWLVLCERHGVRIITMDGECDTATANGRMFLRMRVTIARHEVEIKAARQRNANLDRAERGLPWLSGARPLGYTEDRAGIVESEAEAIRAAYSDVLAGVSLRAIRGRWEKDGPANPSGGNRWPPATFRSVLTRPTYAGLRVYNGVEYPTGVPTIVDVDLWRTVQLVLADPGRRTTDAPGRPIRSLLPGWALCGRCGWTLTSGRARDHKTREYYRTLRCHRTPHLSRRSEPIEDFVTDLVVARLRRKDAARLFARVAPDLTPLRKRAADLRAQRLALAEDITVAHDFAAARDRRLRADLDAVESELAAKSVGSALGALAGAADPGAAWMALDLDARRGIIRELVDVIVLPTGRGGGHGPFDPDTVRTVWRVRA